jgi:hypothetical protein
MGKKMVTAYFQVPEFIEPMNNIYVSRVTRITVTDKLILYAVLFLRGKKKKVPERIV